MSIMFPFLSWFRQVSRRTIASDTIAGIVVALILIPQAIAYSQLAGLPPQQGLYAAFIAPVIAALFGSSRKLSTGPVAVVSLITASAFAALNITSTQTMVEYGIVLAVLVGIIQLVFGFFKLGIIVNFISHPVMLGFSSAAAIIIATSQLPKVFGITVKNLDHHYQTMYQFLLALPSSFHLISFLFAVVSVVAIILLKKIHPLTPGVLIVLIVTTILSWSMGYQQLGGSVVGTIPSGLPRLSNFSINLTAVPTLFSTALIISLLGFMESYSIAKSLALKSGEKINVNQEFIGQGLANLAVACVQGYPVSGSFSRSAVNYQSGAQTGISSIVTGACVLITLLFFTPLLYYLPQSVLSAVIITSVIGLISLSKIKSTYNIIRSDGIIAIITFLTTLFYAPHLDQGILIGITLSTAYYLYTRTKPHIGIFTVNDRNKIIEVHSSNSKQCKYLLLLSFDGSLFFANASYLENKLTEILAQNKDSRCIILDAQGINFIDSSGIETLEGIIKSLEELNKKIIFVRFKEELLEKIRTTELYSYIKTHAYESRSSAIRAVYLKTHKGHSEDGCPLSAISATTFSL